MAMTMTAAIAAVATVTSIAAGATAITAITPCAGSAAATTRTSGTQSRRAGVSPTIRAAIARARRPHRRRPVAAAARSRYRPTRSRGDSTSTRHHEAADFPLAPKRVQTIGRQGLRQHHLVRIDRRRGRRSRIRLRTRHRRIQTHSNCEYRPARPQRQRVPVLLFHFILLTICFE
jgi:hypothetical protein